jgi:ParB family chromosome partitioning protein
MPAQPIGHFEKIRALATSPRYVWLGGVRADRASQVHAYDHVSEKPAYAVPLPSHVNALAWTGEQVVAACADGIVRILAAKDGVVEREIQAHDGECYALAVHKDSLATAGADGALRVFSLSQGKKRLEWPLSSRPLRAVAIDPEGESFAAAGDDGVVRVIGHGGERRDMPGHDGPVRCLSFTPADGRLVSGGDDGTVRIWYLVGAIEADLRGKDDAGHLGGTLALLFLPAKDPQELGERLVSAGADGKVRVWRMSERRKPRTLDAGSDAIHALAFAPSTKSGTLGSLLAAGDNRRVYGFVCDAAGAVGDRGFRWEHGFAVLSEALAAPARARRQEAVRTLGPLAETEATDLLVKALGGDTDAEVRALAASVLASNGRAAARKAIRARLDDGQPVVRAAALDALRALEAETPLLPLRSALDSKYPDTRIAALGLLPPLAAASPLVSGFIAGHLADEDGGVRRAAVAQLVSLHPPSSVEPLRVAFERGKADVRAEVLVRATVAGLTRHTAFAPIVGKALDDDDGDVRRLAFVVSALTHPALGAWLETCDEAFGRALGDLRHRAAQVGGPPAASTDVGRSPAGAPAGTNVGAPREEDREPLLAALACRTADTALRGARGLALLGDMRALGALLTISREADATLRRDAAMALASLADSRARRRIVWMLNDPEATVRDTALAAYSKVETDPLQVAEAALHSSQEDVRIRGLNLLVAQGKGKTGAERLLGDSLEDEAPKVRSEAFRTLWAWHAAEPLGPLDRALSARFPDLRLRAITELTAFAKAERALLKLPALERLQKAIGDRDYGVARASYDAVLDILGKDRVEAHLAAMATTHAALRAQGAKDAVRAPVERVRSVLMKLLEDTEANVRVAAIDAIDRLLPDEPGPLGVGLQSSFLDLRVRAAELLAVRRHESAIDAMRALLADKELLLRMPPAIIVPLRQRAATALADLGSARLVKYFATELVKDDDPFVREQAARGLSNASRRGEEGYLLDLLGHTELPVRSWAAEGLARMGDARALPVLTGTLRHEHPPIRIGAILSFAALGPEGYGGMLAGLEDRSRDVQRIVLSVILARDLRAFRRQEAPELLTSALSSQRPEVRFAAARALELRIDPADYMAHVVEVLAPDRPERAADMERWPDEDRRARMMVALAEALASERPEQRYAAAQALRLRDGPLAYFREVQRAVMPRSITSPWIPETTPRVVEAPSTKARPLGLLRRLFARGAEADEGAAPEPSPSIVPADEQERLRLLAFGAYVGLLRQVSADDESHRVRRDAIDRIVELVAGRHVSIASATPALARALDDPNHLVRGGAFAALQKVYARDPETPLSLALASSSADVVKAALDELASRGEPAKPRIAKALDSRVPAARKYAFDLLEKLSPPGSLEPLLAALASEQTDIRIGVLERLATSQDARVAAALVKALESDHDDLRLRAAEMLAQRRDDRAADALAPWLRAEDAALAGRAREALATLGSAAAVRALSARFDDTIPDAERSALTTALGKTRAAEATIDALSARFADDLEAVRRLAFDAAIAIVGPRSDAKRERGTAPPKPRATALAKRFLEVGVRASAADVRQRAAGELDDLADGAADGWLVSMFGDRDATVRRTAVRSYATRVEKKGSPPGPLEDVLKGGARETMLAAAEGLAGKHVSTALRPLLLFARAGEAGERERALLALGTLGDERSLAELELIASGGTEEAPAEVTMQAAALEALGRLWNGLEPEARDRVRDKVEGSIGIQVPEMAVAAVRALRWIGGERARARIESVLSERSSTDAEKRAAVTSLGEMSDPASESVLAGALEEDDEDTRWGAREALEKLFPADRLRVEFLAVESEQSDISEPAAKYLATEGDPGQLLEKLAKLGSESLRERIRFGLVRRERVGAADLLKLLAADAASSRADAAWVVGARSSVVDEADRKALGPALLAAARRAAAGYAAASRQGKSTERQAELGAWVRATWAARRIDRGALRDDAKRWLVDGRPHAGPGSGASGGASPAVPTEVRLEAARALQRADATALLGVLSDPDIAVRSAAAHALAPTGQVLEPKTSPLDPVRMGLSTEGTPLTADGLRTDEGRRALLPRAIGTGDTGALEQLARSGEGRTRIDCIAALGRAATPGAIETLTALAARGGSSDPEVGKAAYRAVRRARRMAHRKETA